MGRKIKLPVGIEDFKEIRQEEFYYIDKTKLIEQLLELDNPYNCPHGRPTIITMSKYEIEKKFKRIV